LAGRAWCAVGLQEPLAAMRAWPGIARRQDRTVKTEKKDKRPRGASRASSEMRAWMPLFARFREVVEWALDIAAQLARDYDEELEAIERVRGYLRAWLDGRRVDIEMGDVLTTLAILFAAIEIDVGIDSSPLLEPLRSVPSVLRLPGAARDELPTVVIKRFPRRRNAGAAFTQLAA
jgi:hypothetical protein